MQQFIAKDADGQEYSFSFESPKVIQRGNIQFTKAVLRRYVSRGIYIIETVQPFREQRQVICDHPDAP